MFSLKDAFEKDDERFEAVQAEQMLTGLKKILETEGVRILELYFIFQRALKEDNYPNAKEKSKDYKKISFYFNVLRFYLPVIKEIPDINQVLDDVQWSILDGLEKAYHTVVSNNDKIKRSSTKPS